MSLQILLLYIEHVCLAVQSRLTLCHPMDCSPPGSSVPGISQVVFLTQGSNLCLLHWQVDFSFFSFFLFFNHWATWETQRLGESGNWKFLIAQDGEGQVLQSHALLSVVVSVFDRTRNVFLFCILSFPWLLPVYFFGCAGSVVMHRPFTAACRLFSSRGTGGFTSCSAAFSCAQHKLSGTEA